ncbi:hypothetical protein [Bartonella elizabethae]|uniref:hypothetical protein n=1 Tax=Bartonella elizabethae TaxID=807 RepID=UPI00031E7AAF|nr:hypothetical protein [Bartonella elizabethae]
MKGVVSLQSNGNDLHLLWGGALQCGAVQNVLCINRDRCVHFITACVILLLSIAVIACIGVLRGECFVAGAL